MAWQEFYRAGGNAFGILPNSRYYGPQGHRGRDFIHDRGTPIPAYRAGRVDAIEHSQFLGTCVIVRLDEGRFAGWAHAMRVVVDVGDDIGPGDTIAHIAGREDDPGESWDGAHSHTTLGPAASSIFEGTVEDPMRLIGPAIGIESVIAGLKEDDMFENSDRNRLNNVWAGLFSGASVEIDGVVKRFNYGVLPIVAHNQTLIAQQAGRIAALEEAIAQLSAGTDVSLDVSRIDDARLNGIDEFANQNALPLSVELDHIDGVDVVNMNVDEVDRAG
ncbi:M23 family metallopeptidase [Agromyces sp. H3Y2-19a]|uniref:M23 family metallopeptidase n=1 Tax=Agromyces TaxID=33877 RepID=UPI0023B9C6AC|nr:M23 family metallopeptidase [Agromyces chromiiresistens]MDF0513088.1 M23 family metallopeptidase [Agromyces chromiiresistens]